MHLFAEPLVHRPFEPLETRVEREAMQSSLLLRPYECGDPINGLRLTVGNLRASEVSGGKAVLPIEDT